MAKYAVVGGLGFVGSIISDLLITGGHEVDIIDIGLFGNECKQVTAISDDLIHKVNIYDNYKNDWGYDWVVFTHWLTYPDFYSCDIYNHNEAVNNVNRILYSLHEGNSRVMNVVSYSLFEDDTSVLYQLMKETLWSNSFENNVVNFVLPELFGVSPRMRWDNLVNMMILQVVLDNSIEISFNPYKKIHISSVLSQAMKAVDYLLGNQVFDNTKVMYSEGSLSVVELGHMVAQASTSDMDVNVSVNAEEVEKDESINEILIDNSISYNRIQSNMFGSLQLSCKQIMTGLEQGQLPDFLDDRYNNASTMKDLIKYYEIVKKFERR